MIWAETEAGAELVDELAEILDADVAASDDLTGHEALGGDWSLEYVVGELETDIVVSQWAQSHWKHSLAAATFVAADTVTTDGGDSINQDLHSFNRGSVQSVAMDEQGNFVVVWSQFDSGDGWDVFAQRYDVLGNKVGTEFRVNETAGNHQEAATVAMDDDGNFVVSWTSQGQDGGPL